MGYWTTVGTYDDVESATSCLQSGPQQLFDECFPLRNRQIILETSIEMWWWWSENNRKEEEEENNRNEEREKEGKKIKIVEGNLEKNS